MAIFKHLFLWIILMSGAVMTFSACADHLSKDQPPKHLYKVLSFEDWKKSQSQAFLALPKEDEKFIHLSKEDQLERITEKYWSDVPEYIILKIETKQLPGRLVYETNPGGANKYYHLYDGSIPLKAVVEAKTIKN